MGDNKENSGDEKPDGEPKLGYEPAGVLGSAGSGGVGLTRTPSVKKKRKSKSAKASSTDTTGSAGAGVGARRAVSARTTRRVGPPRRNITSQYSQKKLNKRKRSSNAGGGASASAEEDANKYKRDFDEAIAKLTNPNLLTKAARDVNGTAGVGNGSTAQTDGSRREVGVVRRVRSAQSVVGPRPHSVASAGDTGAGARVGLNLNRQTLSVNTNPIQVPMIGGGKDNGIGTSKPYSDRQRPLTATSLGSGRPFTYTTQAEQKSPGASVRPRAEVAGGPPRALPSPNSAIQSRLRTYFSGASSAGSSAGSRSMVATTLKSPAAERAAAPAEDAPVVNGSGANTGTAQSTAAHTTAQPAPVKLKTTTSTITLRPINGLSSKSPSTESLSVSLPPPSPVASHATLLGTKNSHPALAGAGAETGSPGSLLAAKTAAPATVKPRPILKSADVTKARKKLNVRFALTDEFSDE